METELEIQVDGHATYYRVRMPLEDVVSAIQHAFAFGESLTFRTGDHSALCIPSGVMQRAVITAEKIED